MESKVTNSFDRITMEGIASVLNAARVEPETSNTNMGDKLLTQTIDCPTVDEYIQQGAQEIAAAASSAPNSPGPSKKPRGRPKGSKSRSPAPEDTISGEDRTRAYVQKLAERQGEDIRAIALRRKITKVFNYFPHKLRRYFQNIPDVSLMSTQQLIDTYSLLLGILDEGDERVYVKEGFKVVAGMIENGGPTIHSKFLRWCPGADILQCQQGLAKAVDQLADEPGEDGLADPINRIALEFDGWAPTNPYVNAGLAIFKIMKEVQMAKIQAPVNMTSDDPIQNV